MKNTLLLLAMTLFLACSSDDDSSSEANVMNESELRDKAWNLSSMKDTDNSEIATECELEKDMFLFGSTTATKTRGIVSGGNCASVSNTYDSWNVNDGVVEIFWNDTKIRYKAKMKDGKLGLTQYWSQTGDANPNVIPSDELVTYWYSE